MMPEEKGEPDKPDPSSKKKSKKRIRERIRTTNNSSEYFYVPVNLDCATPPGPITPEIANYLKLLIRKYGTVENMAKLRDQSFVNREYETIAEQFDKPQNDGTKIKRVRNLLIKRHASSLPEAEIFWRRLRIGFNSTMRLLEKTHEAPKFKPRLIIVDSEESDQVAVELLRATAARLDCRLVMLPNLVDIFHCSRRNISTVTAAAITATLDDPSPDLDEFCDFVDSTIQILEPPHPHSKELQSRGENLLLRHPGISNLPQPTAEQKKTRNDWDFIPPEFITVPTNSKASRIERRKTLIDEKRKRKMAKRMARKNSRKI